MTFSARLPILALALLWTACGALHLEQTRQPSEADWAVEGGGPERRHETRSELHPPLEEVWMANAAAGFGPGSPLLVGNTILVGTRQGDVYGVNLETGKSLGTKGFGDAIEGTPALDGGLLFVPVGWGKRGLVAYDLRSGRTRWRVKGAPIEVGLLTWQGRVIAADLKGVVRAYDRERGRVQWERSLGEGMSVQSTPVLSEGRLVVATDRGQVVALDPAGGALQWTQVLPAPVYASLAASGGLIFVPTTRGRLFALDAATGQVRWEQAVPDTTVRFTSPAVAGGDLVVGGSDGLVRAFDAQTGAPRWSFAADGAVTAAPLLTPERVYVGTMNKTLYALNRRTGAVEWDEELEGRIKSAMAARGEYLVVLTEPRYVYLFRSSTPHDAVSP